AAVAADGIPVVALLAGIDDAVAAVLVTRPEPARKDAGMVLDVAARVLQHVAALGAARRRGRAGVPVPPSFREDRLPVVARVEAVAARDVGSLELVLERSEAEAHLDSGRLHRARRRRAADRDSRVLLRDGVEDRVVADERLVHVDPPLRRAVVGERAAD